MVTLRALDSRLSRIEALLTHLTKDTRSSITVAGAVQDRYQRGLPLRARDVAILLGVKRETVHMLVYRGKLKRAFQGGLFEPKDVQAYLEARREQQDKSGGQHDDLR